MTEETGKNTSDVAGAAAGDHQDPSVPIDFSTFILSLSSSAAFHLGMASLPETGAPGTKNLPMAKQTIDILTLLREKTKGNLSGEEERLVDDVIYNLRMAYVRESTGKSEQ